VVRSNIVSSWFSRVDRDRSTTCIDGYRFLIANRSGKIKAVEREMSTVGVYAISVAAAMVSMEIQNLRVYERRGLLTPDRTDGGTRLYSPDDVDRLGRIRDLLAEGLNLVGIARVLELEDEVSDLKARLEVSATQGGSSARAPRSRS
jgi:MerR family transcriptional regulator/heat shock protein HspR